MNNPLSFLNLIFDKYSPGLKLVATGSSAFYIDKKFKDSLANQIGSLLITYELSNTLGISVTAIENYAQIRLRQKYDMEFIKFWRSSSGNEVDFVIDNPGIIEKEAFEIKFNSNSFKEKEI